VEADRYREMEAALGGGREHITMIGFSAVRDRKGADNLLTGEIAVEGAALKLRLEARDGTSHLGGRVSERRGRGRMPIGGRAYLPLDRLVGGANRNGGIQLYGLILGVWFAH